MKTHLGTTVALVLGVLVFVSGLSQQLFESINVGFVMIVGALAYKSAKKRRLGEVENTKFRFGMELVGLVVIALSVLALSDIKTAIAIHPLSTVVAPLYALIAYGIEYRKHTK
jgi:phosphatidylserine synthase